MGERLRLGRLTKVVANGARWIGQDDWPSGQVWADEVEQLLQHLDCHDRFETVLPNLRGDNRQRNSAIAEARVAFWFCRNGFKITQWEPKVTNQPGDLEVCWQAGTPIFVEIKQPTWESELSEKERDEGRKRKPRFIHAEARSFDSDGVVRYAAEKSLGKLANDRPNLVVVAENTFVSPLDGAGHESISFWLDDPKYDRIGAIMCFDVVQWAGNEKIEYRTLFVENPRAAGKPWQIPAAVTEGLFVGNPT